MTTVIAIMTNAAAAAIAVGASLGFYCLSLGLYSSLLGYSWLFSGLLRVGGSLVA